MTYNNKEIWLKAPLLGPKVALENDFKEVGNKKIDKWVTKPTLKLISHTYAVYSLKEVREIEAFFLRKKGRFESFFIPSHKKDFTLFEKVASSSQLKIYKASRSYWIFDQQRFIYIPSLNFASRIMDIKSGDSFETFILKEPFVGEIDVDVNLQELINVRLNSDKFEIVKKNATRYEITLSFKEVFYEAL